MKHKYTKKEALKLGWKGLDFYVYSGKDDFERASSALFKVTDRHGKVKKSKK